MATTPAPKQPAKTAEAKTAEDKANEVKANDTATDKPDTTYGDGAADLATDTRKLAESMREDLDKLLERIAKHQENVPGVDDYAASDAIRRIPMSVAVVTDALQGLVASAAELANKAQRPAESEA